MAQVFSHTYHANAQQRFLDAIGERRYQDAFNILNSFPQPDPDSAQEKLIRIKVISQGYEFLVRRMLESYRPKKMEQTHTRMLELRESRAIKDSEGEVANPDSLSEEVEAYRTQGTPEEITAALENLRTLEKLIDERI